MKKKLFKLLNHIIRKGYWFNEIQFQGCRKFWSYKTFNTDVFNLGSTSASCAFDYNGIGLKCANFSISKNPLLGDLSILKNYVGFVKESDAIGLITLCPFSALAGRYDAFDDRYYTFLNPVSIPYFSYRKQCQVKDVYNMPIKYYPIWGAIVDLLHKLKFKKNKRLDENQMKLDASGWIIGWKKEFGIENFEEPLSLINKDAIDVSASILNEIIEFCKRKKIRPVLVIPPIYHTLSELLTPEIRKLLVYSLIEKVSDKEVPFCNYMDNDDFIYDRSLFKNSFLLNSTGARKFTRRIFADLKVF